MAVQPLEKARSLPFSAYTDPVVLEEESTSIFSREWVFVCMAGEVSQPGDYFAMIVANEPVFVLRGEDGELRQKYKHEREKRLREDGNEQYIEVKGDTRFLQ